MFNRLKNIWKALKGEFDEVTPKSSSSIIKEEELKKMWSMINETVEKRNKLFKKMEKLLKC